MYEVSLLFRESVLSSLPPRRSFLGKLELLSLTRVSPLLLLYRLVLLLSLALLGLLQYWVTVRYSVPLASLNASIADQAESLLLLRYLLSGLANVTRVA